MTTFRTTASARTQGQSHRPADVTSLAPHRAAARGALAASRAAVTKMRIERSMSLISLLPAFARLRRASAPGKGSPYARRCPDHRGGSSAPTSKPLSSQRFEPLLGHRPIFAVVELLDQSVVLRTASPSYRFLRRDSANSGQASGPSTDPPCARTYWQWQSVLRAACGHRPDIRLVEFLDSRS